MKAASFKYHRCTSVDQVVSMLQEDPDNTKLIAGGQSLGPLLNLRLARPARLLDISGLQRLAYLEHDRTSLRIGALATHARVEHYPGDLGGFEIVREACRHIGYPPIRENGTVGGSLVHADPTAEWVLIATLLGAVLALRGPDGVRHVEVTDLLVGPFMTSIADDEILVEVCFPRAYDHSALREATRQDGDFALVSAAVAFDAVAGRVVAPRVALAGVAGTATRVPLLEQALEGRRLAQVEHLDPEQVRHELERVAPAHREPHLVALGAELVLQSAVAAASTDRKADHGPR